MASLPMLLLCRSMLASILLLLSMECKRNCCEIVGPAKFKQLALRPTLALLSDAAEMKETVLAKQAWGDVSNRFDAAAATAVLPLMLLLA